jgi:histidine ammonia-lyase
MAPLSARRLADMISLCARVAAIEFVVAAQAIDLRALSVSGLGVSGLGVSGLGVSGLGELGTGTGRAYRMIRELVPFTQADDTFPADLEPVVDLVTRGDLTPAA